jgi:hypothetical protein
MAVSIIRRASRVMIAKFPQTRAMIKTKKKYITGAVIVANRIFQRVVWK